MNITISFLMGWEKRAGSCAGQEGNGLSTFKQGNGWLALWTCITAVQSVMYPNFERISFGKVTGML